MCLEERTKKRALGGCFFSTVTALLDAVSVGLWTAATRWHRRLEVFVEREVGAGGKGRCVLFFSCEVGDCTDGFDHFCVVKTSVKSQETVWRGQKTELLSGPRPLPLCTDKTLVQTLDLMQVHFFDFKLFMLALAIVQFFLILFFQKGRATHPVKTFCVFGVFIFFFPRSKIIYLLRFKLFLTIFKCIYVSFFYINCWQIRITHVLLSIKKNGVSFVEHEVHVCAFFSPFLEILTSCILTFSSLQL